MSGCCPHPASEHGDDGCLHGWGEVGGTTGCLCMRRGMADEQRWRS